MSICLYFTLTGFFYFAYEHIWFKNIDKNTKIDNKYKQVNYLKGVVLGTLFPFSIDIIYSIIFLDTIPKFVNLFGALYASLDMSSTLYNYKLNHISTNIHHISVQILYFYCIYNKWNINTLCNPIILYAAFSALSFIVNYRLAIRGTDKHYENIINNIALYTYVYFSILNWIVQLYILFISNRVELFNNYIKNAYCLIVLFIICDDIYLIKFLKNNN